MKVAVYGVAKNEEANLDKWYQSVKDADYILLVDTGSTDATVEKAKSFGINVVEISLDPWDETLAKNIAKALVPRDYDYMICLDLDEYIMTENWKSNLLKYTEDILLVTLYSEDGLSTTKRDTAKIHRKKSTIWMNYRPVLHKFTDNGLVGGISNCPHSGIEIGSIIGTDERFQDRESLYIKSYLNFLHIYRFYQSDKLLPSIIFFLAMSYYENNQYEECREYAKEYYDLFKDSNEKSTGMSIILLIFALLVPSKAESLLLRAEDYSESVSFTKYILIKQAIVFYKKGMYENALNVLNKIKNNSEINNYQMHDFSQEDLEYFLQICNNQTEATAAFDAKMLRIFSYVGMGKNHDKLAEESFKVFKNR